MSITERGPSWSERLNPRNWSLRVKLLIVGLVPTLLALALGALRVSDQSAVAANLGQSNELLQIRGQVDDTADALRTERDAAVRFVAANRPPDRGAVDSAIAATDAKAVAMQQSLAADDDAATPAPDRLTEALAGLPALRNDTLGSTVPAEVITSRYTAAIQQADVFDRALLRQVSTPDVAGLTDAVTAVTSASEQLALQHTILGGAIAAGQLREADRTAVAGADSAFDAAVASYQLALTPEQQRSFGTFGADPAESRVQLATQILQTADDRPIAVDPAAWDAAYAASAEAVDRSGTAVDAQLKNSTVAAQDAASNEAGINSVILMLFLLLAIAIIVLLARSLIRSLRVLRNSALNVAEHQLPEAVESLRSGGTPNTHVEPVPITSRDEVGQVARAFDAVHGQAIRLAADQAGLQANVNSMFVNLSRRSQALVERQLQLIEQLESNEQDADQLSNLFQLDHLATRMRRNSENLLVLAGADASKRNLAPVPVVDVLRAAVSEIEQYQRIMVQTPPKTAIVGRAASDLVHLLSELLDNATNFSPPDSQVVLSCARTSNGSILIEILDRGIGMPESALADANERLNAPSAVDVSASRRMGLFVVGRLATRHNIEVQLGVSAGGGLTGSVTVPAVLIPSVAEPEGPPPAAIATASVQAAGSNGHSPQGSLSALVMGTDGPMSPAGAVPGANGSVFALNGSADEHAANMPRREPGQALVNASAQDNGRPSADEPVEAEYVTGMDFLAGSGPGSSMVQSQRVRRSAPGQKPATAEISDATAGLHFLAGAPANGAGADERLVAEQIPRPSGRLTPSPRVAGRRIPLPEDRFMPGRRQEPRMPARPQEALAPPRLPDAPLPTRPQQAAPERQLDARNDAPPLPVRKQDTVLPPRAPQDRPDRPQDAPPPVRAPQDRPDRPQDAPPPARAPQIPQDAPPPVRAPQNRPDRLQDAPPPIRAQDALMPPRPQDRLPNLPGRPRDGLVAGRPQAGLFAPAGPPPAAPDAAQGSDLGSPIFEEIASAWFRSNRPIPVNWAERVRNRSEGAGAPQPGQPLAVRQPGQPNGAGPVQPPARQAPVAPAAPAPVAAAPGQDDAFATEADEGWNAAQETAVPTDGDDVTAAGLPKRRPRARLIPGSAAGSAVLAPSSPARTAEAVRGRLASYQQGVRQGRENRLRRQRESVDINPAGSPDGQPAAAGEQDEETR